MTVNILYLYPKEMNLYGDTGNILALRRRLEWRGHQANVIEYEPGDPFPEQADIIFGGGGQDSGQARIEEDLKKIGPKLKAMVEDGTPTLVVCGLYQLFGHYFQSHEGQKIQGMSILDLHTIGGDTRLIGNITIQSEQFGEVVGYENHSGLTYLGEGATPLGTVVKGDGNNGKDQTEGMLYKNCIGTYLHGPILPKNPAVVDFLIGKALERRGVTESLAPLDDAREQRAHEVSGSRPR